MTEHAEPEQTSDGLEYPDSLEAAAVALRKLDPDDPQDAWKALHVLRIAAGLGDADATSVLRFMREYLLPGCLFEAEPKDSHGRLRASRLREMLFEWLGALPEKTLWPVREGLLDALLTHLKTLPKFATIYCIATVGYRSPAIVEGLQELAGRQDRLGHEALRILIGLRPDEHVISWASDVIAETPRGHHTEELWNAAARLHSARWIEPLAQEAQKEESSLFALSRLAWIGEDAPGDRGLQDAVWAAIRQVVEDRPYGWRRLLFAGGIIERCNTPDVLTSLLAWLPQIAADDEIQIRRWADRVAEAESPLQLRGWTGDALSHVQMLQRYFERDSGARTPSQTAESQTKELAIEVTLRSGLQTALLMPDLALRHEVNPYLKAHILRQTAALSLPALPESVRNTLTHTHDLERRGDDENQLIVFLGSAGLAASSLHYRSLELLVNSDGGLNGNPFTVPVRRASQLALWLHEHGDSRILPLLLGTTIRQTAMSMSVRVYSLRLMAARAALPGEAVSVLRGIVGDLSQKPYVRLDALRALISHARMAPFDGFENLLAELCSSTERSLAHAAAAVLIDARLLPNYRREIEAVAFPGGLETGASRDAAHIVGQLACIEPGRYAARAGELVRSRARDVTASVMSAVRETTDALGLPVPDDITDAVIAIVRRDETSYRANTPIFGDLATVAPSRLLTEAWEELWHRWMAHSREALADALPFAAMRVEPLTTRAGDLLEWLLGDSAFAVRRAAARALARLDVERLREWCREALDGGSIALKSRAAEAASWLPVDDPRTMDNELLREARDDEERSVRDAANRGRSDLKYRTWSAELLDGILKPRLDPNDWVLSCYTAGSTLRDIGDDTTLLALEQAADDVSFPPNVRYWIECIAEDLEKNWKKTTGKWPDAWLPWRGEVERQSGVLRLGDREDTVTFLLWLKRARGSNEQAEWGGAVSLEPSGSQAWQFAAAHDGYADVQIPGRKHAKAVIVEGNYGQLILSGTGEYPSEP